MMASHPLVVLGKFLLISIILSGCAAFNQTHDEVVVRGPGTRFLGKPSPNQSEAKIHWQYAWLSDAAYARAVDGESKDICTATSAEAVVAKHGWKRWTNFPLADGHLDNVMRNSHLRAEVWENRDLKQVVVAFGGTESKSGKDWKSNLRWITFKVDDEYTLLVKGFGPAFVDEFSKRAQSEQGRWLKEAKLISTGHSLGGGLAQQFAYALPGSSKDLKVTQVYAFDPSPVTGFFSVDPATRDVNRVGLSIDRIYERGEILALLRSFTSLFVEPSTTDPTIRAVRYSLLNGGNAVANHSMHDFACAIQKASGASVGELL
jgi:hypothetical protein